MGTGRSGEGDLRVSSEPGRTGEISWLNPSLGRDKARGAEREHALPASPRTLRVPEAELLTPSQTLFPDPQAEGEVRVCCVFIHLFVPALIHLCVY